MRATTTIDFIVSNLIDKDSREMDAINDMFKDTVGEAALAVENILTYKEGIEAALAAYGDNTFDYQTLVDYIGNNKDTIKQRIVELSEKYSTDMTTYVLSECQVDCYFGREENLLEFSRKYMVILSKLYNAATSAVDIFDRLSSLVKNGHIRDFKWLRYSKLYGPMDNAIVIGTREDGIYMDGKDIHNIIHLSNLFTVLMKD